MANRRVSLVLVTLSMLLFSAAASAQTAQFDPHDFTGYYLKNTVRPKEHPPLTQAGMDAMKDRHPDSSVKLPTDSNDPMYKCNPQGFPRLVYEENEPVEFIMLPDRVLQF